MEIPATAAHFIAIIVIALPGVTYATARNRARGLAASSISTGSKIGEGLAAGVVFDAVYLWIFGDTLVDAFTLRNDALPDVQAAAGYALLLGVGAPAVVAWLVHRGTRWTRPTGGPVRWIATRVDGAKTWLRDWLASSVGLLAPAFSRTPSAWDFAAPTRGERFVRIEMADGRFVGGWFASNSFVSTYPEPRDIFVERQWEIGSDGTFECEVPGSDGFWYSLQPGDIIDWVEPPAAADERHDPGSEPDGAGATALDHRRRDTRSKDPDPGRTAGRVTDGRTASRLHVAQFAAAWVGGLLYRRLRSKVAEASERPSGRSEA